VLAALSLPGFWTGNWAGARLFEFGSEHAYRRIAILCLIAMAFVSAAPAVASIIRRIVATP